MRFRLSRRADSDLADLYRWGAVEFGFAVADAYYDGLLNLCELLSQNPHMARDFGGGIRAYAYRSHAVIYVEQDGTIEILRVHHGRSDWRRYL